jgi:outer membrane protein TolC
LSILLGLSSSPALAAEAMSVSQAVKIALERNPTVQTDQEKLTELDADVSQARSAIFPSVSATGNLQYKKDPITNPLALFGGTPYNNFNVGFTATQPLWQSGGLTGAIDVAKSNLTIAEITRAEAARDLTLNVITSFYSMILYQHQLETLKKEEAVYDELIKTVTRYYKVGRAQLVDVLQTKTQAAALVPRIAQAANQVQIAATQLATYLGDRLAPEIAVRGSLDMPDRSVLERNLKARKYPILELEAVEEQLRQVDYNRTVALAKDLPSVSATGTIARTSYVNTDLLNDDATNWAVGVQFTIPIFSGLSTVHERRAFASQEMQLQISRSGILDQTTLNQVQALRNLDISQDTTKTSRTAYDFAQQSFAEALRMYKLGTVNLQQLQISQQSSLDTGVSLDQSQYDYITKLSQYAISMGYPPEDLVKLLENKP